MNPETLHQKIKTDLLAVKGVTKVSEVLELPNPYGADTSSFSIRHSQTDQFNYRVFDFNIEWNTKILFIRLQGYIPFKDSVELQELIMSKLRDKM
jgi:hypothetical protein